MSAPSIRTRLATLVLAAAAPAVLLVVGLLGLEHRRDREVLERDSIATARAMTSAIDRELAAITAAAQVLATSQRAQAGDVAAFHAQARQVVEGRIGAIVVLSDTEGRQVMNTLRPRGEPLPLHGNPSQLRAVLETGRPAVSNLYTGGVLRRPVVSVDVPVLRDGRIVYVLSVGETPERFRTILSQQKLPGGWIGAVFDRSGTIVARTAEHERFVGEKGSPALVERMASQSEGALETVTREGIPVVSMFSRSAASGWTVALGIPLASINERLWLRAGTAAGVAAAILLIGLAMAWAIGGSIAASVRGLLAPAAQISSREAVSVPPLGLREADEVGQALARASALLVNAEHRARHDPLTGLANRALFLEMAAHEIERCKRDLTSVALLFIDMDGFKRVNDLYGHDAGDRLLCAVAGRLAKAVRSEDIAARLGGDEFAVLLEHADSALAAAIAAKLVDTLSAPYDIGERAVEVSASIGVAAYPQSGASAERVLKRADEAMYAAKLAGKRGHAVAGAA